MAIFGIEGTMEFPEDYLNSIRNKIKSGNLVKNPFKGQIFQREKTLIVEITPIYLNFPLYGLILAGIITILLGRLSWVIAPFILISLFGFLWSAHFYYLVFKWGLKKKGYIGVVNRLKKDELIRRALTWAR